MTVNAKKLALDLLEATSEHQVIALLKAAGYWEDPNAWRLYGDSESNFSTIGNQQSRPEAALVEKVVNSVDARLMAACMAQGIDPASSSAPQSINEAVSVFFGGGRTNPGAGALLKDWPVERQRQEASHITLAVTGFKPGSGNACITLADTGEGQSPSRVPETFLSLDRQNKLRIPFVQGKFNMGGTGVLKFCGTENVELLITKRNPSVAAARNERDPDLDSWSVTVVRRERPSHGAGRVRNSVYRFLAPVGAETNPNKGTLLTFKAATLKMMPERNIPYEREMSFGSVLKLYEYDMKGFKSHALMKGGLLARLELLLPGIALPVRVHECRKYEGHEGSYANSLVGLLARLEEDRAGNLEDGYPTSIQLRVRGEPMVAQIYAFKADKAESYASAEGVIFTVNGQTHASLSRAFFEHRKVRMQRLARSLLIVVDCTDLSVGAREDLFMNSRDRLSNGELRKAIEEELEESIGRHPGLRALQDRRRSEEISERLAESKPLEDVLGSILKSSPSLSALFLRGSRLSNPHRQSGKDEGGNGAGAENGNGQFIGRPHPTFFRFYDKANGAELSRNAELGRRCRMRFETDAANDYFSRAQVRGEYHVEVVDGPLEGVDIDHSIALHDGVANWSINLPEDSLSKGDPVTLACTVTDPTLVEPFVGVARVVMVEKAPGGDVTTNGSRTSRTGKGTAKRTGGGRGKDDPKGQPAPDGLQMPNIVKVKRGDTNWTRYRFDEHDACYPVDDTPVGETQQAFTFYVNVDNVALRTEMKGNADAVRLIEAKFTYACVLVGLALIHDARSRVVRNGEKQANERPVSDQVRAISKALGPFLVPMIDNLGALTDDQITGLSQQGDDD